MPDMVLIYPDLGKNIRTEIVDNEPFFCFYDIVESLAALNRATDDTFKGLLGSYSQDLDEDELIILVKNSINEYDKRYVSESGLYRIIMRDSSSACKSFQKWVLKDVLPSLRKYGTYPPPNQNVHKSELLSAAEQIALVSSALVSEIKERERLEIELKGRLISHEDRLNKLSDKVAAIGNKSNQETISAEEFLAAHNISDVSHQMVRGWAINHCATQGYASTEKIINENIVLCFEVEALVAAVESARKDKDGL